MWLKYVGLEVQHFGGEIGRDLAQGEAISVLDKGVAEALIASGEFAPLEVETPASGGGKKSKDKEVSDGNG